MLSSAVVAVTPCNLFNSATVDVIPSSAFNSAAVEVTAVPEIFHCPTFKFGFTNVVPSKRLSIESKLVLTLVPQELSEAPTSGFTRVKVGICHAFTPLY